MKLKNLDLGKALTRAEMKEIKGSGGTPCPTNSGTTDCTCMNSRHACVTGDGIHSPQDACNNWCMTSFGVTGTGSTCVLGACQP